MDNKLEKLQELEANIAARMLAIQKERSWWPCQKCCDQCCRQLAHPPELTQLEWMRVDKAVAALPMPRRLLIQQKIDELLKQIASNTVSPKVVCPYLDEEHRSCQIYEARPVACRTYGFYIARTHSQYCQIIETEVDARDEVNIIWGNAEAVTNNLQLISGMPISFEEHYTQDI